MMVMKAQKKKLASNTGKIKKIIRDKIEIIRRENKAIKQFKTVVSWKKAFT